MNALETLINILNRGRQRAGRATTVAPPMSPSVSSFCAVCRLRHQSLDSREVTNGPR